MKRSYLKYALLDCDVTFSITFPSKLYLLILYHIFDFPLKSPISTTKTECFWTKPSKFNLICWKILQIHLLFALEVQQSNKITKFVSPIFSSISRHSCKYWMFKTLRCKTFCNKYKHLRVYCCLMDDLIALNSTLKFWDCNCQMQY